jgi:YVTN family beta-propeller protein
MKSILPKHLGRNSMALPVHGDRSPPRGLMVLAAVALMMSSVAIVQAQTGPVYRGGSVYTANEHDNSISAIDLAAGSVTTVPIDVSPHNVQITADGTRLLAVGELVAEGHGHSSSKGAHGGDKAKGRLLVFDAANLASRILDEFVVGTHPAHVVVNQSGERAFVTNGGDNTVSVVDLAARKLIATIGTGGYPHGLRISPDGRELYVANVQGGTVSVIDAKGLTELARIPVGDTPVQVAFTPDGRRVYVSLRDANKVAVVDTATRSLITTIDVGPSPIQVHVTPDGRFVYVANQGTDSQPNDTVSVIEAATANVVNTIRTGRGAHGVVASGDGALVFVTNIVEGTVSAIDTSTRKVIAEFSVGRGPNGITYRSPKR